MLQGIVMGYDVKGSLGVSGERLCVKCPKHVTGESIWTATHISDGL